nr:MAG TPA: hypothetical protein [Caudoviricetes sp.]
MKPPLHNLILLTTSQLVDFFLVGYASNRLFLFLLTFLFLYVIILI